MIVNEGQNAENSESLAISQTERNHANLMERIALLSRTNAEKFTVTDRLEAIRKELNDSEYSETFEGTLFSLWSKKPISELPKNIVLISSHADVVPSITECYSILNEDGFYKGTYDNLSTNAAMLILMLEANLPDNVVFAFTGDEETGRCGGAKEVSKYLLEKGANLTCIALDVTYEGFNENALMSIENCTAPQEEKDEFLNKVANAAMSSENEKSFCFVKAREGYIPSELKKEYLTPSSGMYDEAFAYRDMGQKALSVCIPCTGYMHSNSGLSIKQPVFEGYLLSIESLVLNLLKENPEKVEKNKIRKDYFLKRAEGIKYRPYTPSYSSPNINNDYGRDDYDDEDEEYGEDTFDNSLEEFVRNLYAKAFEYDRDNLAGFINDNFSSETLAAFEIEDMDSYISFLQSVFKEVQDLKSGENESRDYLCIEDYEEDDD